MPEKMASTLYYVQSSSSGTILGRGGGGTSVPILAEKVPNEEASRCRSASGYIDLGYVSGCRPGSEKTATYLAVLKDFAMFTLIIMLS